MKKIQMVILASMLACAATANAHEGHDDQGVAFETPKDGATLEHTFKVEMEVEGMKIQPAGDLAEGTGHFHIIIDQGCVKKGEAVAKDGTHLHYGKGQTETYLSLKSGQHTLSLQLADGHHVSYGKQWCKTIGVTVK